MQIRGYYFAPNQSDRHDAIFMVNHSDEVAIKSTHDVSTALLHVSNMANLTVSSRIGNTPRFISFSNGASFETLDNHHVDDWLKDHRKKNSLGWIHRLESHLLFVIMVVIFVSTFSWGFIQYGVPSIAKSAAQFIPFEVSEHLGQGTLTLLDNSYFSDSTLSKRRQHSLLQRFNQYSQSFKHLNVQVIFRHGGKIGANAFALPDGHIVFTDEIINLAQNDDELITIFAHEVGHLERRHLLRRVIQDSMIASLVVLMTGDISYASSVIIVIPSVLLELAYSRQFETEADEFALQFLKQNQIATIHFANMMRRLEKEQNDSSHEANNQSVTFDENPSSYWSSHPATEERIKPFLEN